MKNVVIIRKIKRKRDGGEKGMKKVEMMVNIDMRKMRIW